MTTTGTTPLNDEQVFILSRFVRLMSEPGNQADLGVSIDNWRKENGRNLPPNGLALVTHTCSGLSNADMNAGYLISRAPSIRWLATWHRIIKSDILRCFVPERFVPIKALTNQLMELYHASLDVKPASDSDNLTAEVMTAIMPAQLLDPVDDRPDRIGEMRIGDLMFTSNRAVRVDRKGHSWLNPAGTVFPTGRNFNNLAIEHRVDGFHIWTSPEWRWQAVYDPETLKDDLPIKEVHFFEEVSTEEA